MNEQKKQQQAEPKKKRQKKGRRRAALGHEDPHRMCVVCRASKVPHEMLRFARAPDGGVGFDIKAVLPGRGAWVCADAKCLEKATDPKQGAKDGYWARAFDAACVFDPKGLCLQVRALLLDDVLARLGLLRRQGALVVGRDEVFRKKDMFCFVGLAADLSENSKKEAQEQLPSTTILPLPTMEIIADAIGTRAVGVVGVPKGNDNLMHAVRRWMTTTT